ncbi:PEP-CTERM sorting domain-containing protein [Luteolibacter flavescens]|uniref:PEP-CTERM sorting domain-containing protein n=1 Tax=Luteolibacter flavescens TaxID=1859460 RepID=A0ABT3FS10_9BACT|nr:PEP-CTERM sorting domain-containing protein [Luteolibacter flavescens]MCW1886376.1 PEP-CTERM sorting domain-containing protein [Luteolibacter flavescens]
MRKKINLAWLLFALPVGTSGAATVLYSENFNNEASPNYNAGTTPETNFGGLIGVLQSSGTGQGNNAGSTAWQFSSGLAGGASGGGSNGLRFGTSPGFNWATGPIGSLILADGGFSVSYDFDLNGFGAADDWMSVRVGNSAENIGVNNANVDYGVLTRGDGRMQTFEGGGPTMDVNEMGTASAPTVHRFTLQYAFTSFAAGSTVNFTGFVDGVPIGTDTFTWNGTDDVKIFLGGRVNGSLIDNVQVSTIPEPSVALLSGLGILALVRRRRI